MILSARAIEEKIHNGEIVITPFDPKNLKSSSYTFTLGKRLRKLKQEQELDLRVDPVLEEIPFPEDGFVLRPGEFILAETAEKVSLNGKVACTLSTRATIAMAGVDVMQSSSYCEPDTDNTFTLEISNAGSMPVRLFPGIKIVKGVFVLLVA
jgi:dCTP deaminase